jgi:LacI family transcriptional regulator
MKSKTIKASVGNIARLAGVSTTTASVALKNQPGVGVAKRKQILRIAKKLGYAPDANIGSWMARVRDAKSKELLPIAWLNTAGERDAFQRYRFQSPLWEGARARAQELGYNLEDIWCHEPGMTMRRLTKILYQRGIEGVIVTHPAKHFRLDWDHLASVSLGSSLLVPKLHRVTADFNFNFQLALKSLKRLGYKRIGVCLGQEVDSYSHFTIRATASAFYSSASRAEQIPPLFHPHYVFSKNISETAGREEELVAWFKRHRPEVIVGHDNRIEQWVKAAGYRVPEDVGIVHLAVDDDVLDWAGIYSRRREVAAAAVDWLVSLMRNHQYGVSKAPLHILMRGLWQNGRTLGPPPKTKIQP